MKNATFAILNENIKTLPVYLNGVAHNYKQEHVKRETGHNHFIYLQGLKGKGKVFLGNQTYILDNTKAMLIYPNEPHEYYAIEDDWYVDWIDFDGNGVYSIFQNFVHLTTSLYYIKNQELISSKIKRTISLLEAPSRNRNVDCSSLLYSILIDIAKYTSLENTEDNLNKKRLASILDYIDNNYQNIILLEDLASIINISREYLCFLFKKELGIRPIEYINSVRISKSKKILMNNKLLKIDQVAKSVGFESTSYFCSKFKTIEGISPTKFKTLY